MAEYLWGRTLRRSRAKEEADLLERQRVLPSPAAEGARADSLYFPAGLKCAENYTSRPPRKHPLRNIPAIELTFV
ncbi:hypothetical protein SAMN05444955_109125 [Lihuaxuella thermophila]|uniref:Uncharacterized protein n=1 Tax=Lihuaxuella thermophila TaxID=1173111 RepID=A0A1H8FXP1_9BACL|nr:hypothetical protein SAMN05444955_109125 [Lihuaxuella thermophila]